MQPIAEPLLAWYHTKGQRTLPWHSKDPYKVWVSEIMLQQTQVTTVKNYYPRFIRAFPRVSDLAAASLDDVTSLWAGLGYYRRARYLHQAAKIVVNKYKGRVPLNFDDLISLPGIGASTAGAILSLSRNLRYAILDTNVKRVLIRYFALQPDNLSQAKLWEIANQQLPQDEVATYNQALMNLGASVCRAINPLCHDCPLMDNCLAFRHGLTQSLPQPKQSRKLSQRQGYFAFIINERGEVLLERRPPIGIWSSLWCPPQFDNLSQLKTGMKQKFGNQITFDAPLPPVRHSFSHFHLLINPIVLHLNKQVIGLMEADQMWYNTTKRQRAGLPAPIYRLMKQLTETNHA